METESPDMTAAIRLLEGLALRGFVFRRTGPGDDAPLVGNRVCGHWIDIIIQIDGFSRDCVAWRRRTSPLIVPGGELMDRRVQGGALMVLNEVLAWEPKP